MPLHAIVADADRAVNRYVVTALAGQVGVIRHLDGPWEVADAVCADTMLIVVGGSGDGVSATDAVRTLRGRGFATPIVILTNGSDLDADALADADPAVRVQAKPFTPSDLLTAVRGFIGVRQADDTAASQTHIQCRVPRCAGRK